MRAAVWLGTVVAVLITGTGELRAEPPCCPPAPDSFLERLGPAGGWFPYGGGLLGWWPRHCFPCCGAPDDYCRKSLPCVCWPPYPPYYVGGPPETCCPRTSCPPACKEAR